MWHPPKIVEKYLKVRLHIRLKHLNNQIHIKSVRSRANKQINRYVKWGSKPCTFIFPFLIYLIHYSSAVRGFPFFRLFFLFSVFSLAGELKHLRALFRPLWFTPTCTPKKLSLSLASLGNLQLFLDGRPEDLLYSMIVISMRTWVICNPEKINDVDDDTKFNDTSVTLYKQL